MRLLFVAGRFPFPPLRGDQARAWQQLRWLAARHTITLVAPRAPSRASARAVDGLGLERVVAPGPRPTQLTGFLAGLARGLPAQSAWPSSPALSRLLGHLLGQRRHDLVHVQLARLEPALPPQLALPVVVDLTDALSANMRRRAERDRGPGGWAARLESVRLARLERAICSRRDLVTVVSEADRAALGDFPSLRLNPNGVDPEAFGPAPWPRPERAILSGNLGYFPNVDAAVWLAREVWPRVRAQRPAAELVLAGDRPARLVRALARPGSGIHVTGRVPDLAAEIGRARVAVAPLRAGSGQQLKVLEALACATPVVAMPLAAAGLPGDTRQGLLVADSAEDLAVRLQELLSDPARAEALGRAGRDNVTQRWSWAASVAQLEAAYEELLARRSSTEV